MENFIVTHQISGNFDEEVLVALTANVLSDLDRICKFDGLYLHLQKHIINIHVLYPSSWVVEVHLLRQRVLRDP